MKIATLIIAIIALIVAVGGVIKLSIDRDYTNAGVHELDNAVFSYWDVTDGQEWHTGLVDRVSGLEERVDELEKQQ
jgi:hypothetical protein